MGYFVIIFFSLGIVVFLVNLFPGSGYLRLSERGFETKTLFRLHFNPWSQVERFEVRFIGRRKMVVYELSDESKGKLAAFAKELTGFAAALPDTYGHSAEELAALMNEWRSRYSK